MKGFLSQSGQFIAYNLQSHRCGKLCEMEMIIANARVCVCLGVCRKWNTSKKRPRWCTCSSVSRKHHLLSVPSHVLTVTYTKQPRLKHVRCYKILHFHIDRCSYLLKRRLMSMPFMSICCSKEWRRWQSMEEKVCKTSILINATLGNQFVVIVHEELMCVWRNVKASAQSPFMPTVFFFSIPVVARHHHQMSLWLQMSPLLLHSCTTFPWKSPQMLSSCFHLSLSCKRLFFVATYVVCFSDQEERTKAIEAFKEGKKDVLVATDVASKGLDFPAIQHVVNYDMPEEIENYGKRV